ncbi:hypothetical protein AB0M43_11450 [Longispora sp. NPDC051575]|uniref:hypothetical protein n=1 Tax=Longispora sp. NPDC051575 TaxID=3154943 RepID=UPI00342042E6
MKLPEDELRVTFDGPAPAARPARVPGRARPALAVAGLVALLVALAVAAPWSADPPRRQAATTPASGPAPAGPGRPGTAAPPPAALDLVYGSGSSWVVRAADGRETVLPSEPLNTVFRVPEGLLAVTDGARLRAWLITPADRVLLIDEDDSDGTRASQLLGTGHGRAGPDVGVSPDGRRVAWRSGTEVRVATVTRGGLTGTRSVAVPVRTRVVGWHGPYVLLGRIAELPPDANGVLEHLDRYDAWNPDGGGFTPTWNTGVRHVWGPASDGRSLVGSVGGCLALLDPLDGLRPVRQRCDAGLRLDGALLSPGGRWLLGAGDSGPLLLDVDGTLADGRAPRPLPPGDPWGWRDADTPVLVSRTDALPAGEGVLTQYPSGGPGVVLGGTGRGGIQVVARP